MLPHLVAGGRTGGFAGSLKRVSSPPTPKCYGARLPLPAALGGVHAFTTGTPAAVWASGPVAFSLDAGLPAEVRAAFRVAVRRWEEASAFRAVVTEVPAFAAADDGRNGLYVDQATWALTPGALGETVLAVGGDGYLHDADIHLNAAGYRFGTATAASAPAGQVDLEGVLVHELGHALGLGHSLSPGATMQAAYPAGVAWRSLEADDVAGAQSLYPGAGIAGCDGTAQRSCPDAYLCLGVRCQPQRGLGDLCAPCDRATDACAAAGDDARCVDLTGLGRVCGRSCSGDDACGVGFHCKPTTEAGDLQCIADDACRSGPLPCATDAQCTQGVCRNGACMGRLDLPLADAGAADSAGSSGSSGSSGSATPSPGTAGGGCATSHEGASPDVLVLLLPLLLTTLVRRYARHAKKT